MGKEQDKVERLFAAIDSKRPNAVTLVIAPDAEMVSPSGAFRGPEQIEQYVGSWNSGFPNGTHTIDAAVEGDGIVAVEGHWTGTHTGTLVTPTGEIPATGKKVTLWFAGVMRYDGELVTSIHAYFDQISFMGQLGLVPQPASA